MDTVGNIIKPEFPVALAGGHQHCQSIAFDGTNYLVVWADSRGTTYDIYGARVTKSGTVLDANGKLLIGGDGAQYSPAVTFNGTNYIVVYRDNSSGSLDIEGVVINTSLEVVDQFVVSNQYGDDVSPAVVAGTGGQVLSLYEGFTPTPYNSMRICGRFYSEVGIEEAGNPKSEIRNPRLVVYPNPFSTTTAIKLSGYQATKSDNPIARSLDSSVALEIYDLSGRLIRTFRVNLCSYPCQSVSWDGRDAQGKEVQSGIYFIKLQNANPLVKKVVVIR